MTPSERMLSSESRPGAVHRAPGGHDADHVHAVDAVHGGDHHVDVGNAPPVRPASTRNVIIVAAIVAVVLLALFVATTLPRRTVDHELAHEVALQEAPPVVGATQVRRGADAGQLSLPGTFQAVHEGAIYARVGGYVRQWRVDIGSLVRAGDVLATIDAPELSQEVQQAQQQLAQARAALGLARADLERWRTLATDSAVTRQELDQKQAAYDQALANVGAAQANVSRLVQMQSFTRVTAPITGVVTARNVDIGSLVSSAGSTNSPITSAGAQNQGALFRVAQTDTVRTYVSVPESYAVVVSPGLTADVTVQELPGRHFTGRVVRTSGSLDAASRTLLTEVDVVNPGFTLIPGMYAQVHMQLSGATPPLQVPASALVLRGGGTQLAVLEPSAQGNTSVVHLRSVEIGRDHGGTVDIVSGVQEGETVVTSPNAELVDGMTVRVGGAPAADAPATAAAPRPGAGAR